MHILNYEPEASQANKFRRYIKAEAAGVGFYPKNLLSPLKPRATNLMCLYLPAGNTLATCHSDVKFYISKEQQATWKRHFATNLVRSTWLFHLPQRNLGLLRQVVSWWPRLSKMRLPNRRKLQRNFGSLWERDFAKRKGR